MEGHFERHCSRTTNKTQLNGRDQQNTPHKETVVHMKRSDTITFQPDEGIEEA